MTRYRITVPATSANLGPGFDTLGLALDLCARVTVEIDGESDEIALVQSSESSSFDPHDNLICRAYRYWREQAGDALPGARFSVESDIPVGRGFGSSAVCIVAGLAAAAVATETKDARSRILDWATVLEGHPDNIAPAVLGGLTVAFRTGEHVRALHVANHLAFSVVFFVPDDELKTEEARSLIPTNVPFADAVFDLGRLGYLVAALNAGRWECIGDAMDDRLHQPYRQKVIPALGDVIAAARGAGAYGAALSGGGPSVIALSPREKEDAVAEAMKTIAGERGWAGHSLITRVREQGVAVQKLKDDNEAEPDGSE
jgi:homoserine kinase